MTDKSVGVGADRLLALSDGVFAIAITLLVLDITIPEGLDGHAFDAALHALIPHIAAYVLSFVVIAAFWRDHRRIFQSVSGIDDGLLTLAMLGLGLVALIPFPTALLAEYSGQRQSVAIYAAVVAAVDTIQLTMVLWIWRHPRLLRARVPVPVIRNLVQDIGSTVVVFALSIPIAFISATAAMWCWLLLVPLKIGIGRQGRTLGL
ncbi:TMEM175 family protein [Nocardia sp. JMUB6875]|uniref:TMEM175 family protein n=1 Tax=Nocardia sp. JMUB6875 TaxID=3158170 RepID=UPI0032E668E6